MSSLNNSANQRSNQQSGAWNNQQQQSEAWKNQQSGAWNQQQQQGLNTYTSGNQKPLGHMEQVLLPTRVIEKPAAIHEEIRKELVEEIQPVVNVEKFHTEIHQVTQPLYDKEVRNVQIENRTLPSEYLPEVQVQGRGARSAQELSTTKYLDTATAIVEKPAMYNEVERKQIIEEIQPVIYKETVVPTVIQETKPIYQKIVEGAVYTQEQLASKDITNRSNIAPAYVTSNEVIAPTKERHMMPTQIVEKPAAVHEEIRRETIEEITPVWNVEKLKTEVHQITAPLYDKEVKPVTYEKKLLNTEFLPEVRVDGRGFRATDDTSSTRYLDTKTTLTEKPAIYNEVERTQVIEEIQPVIYKETVVPSVIRETKPIFQKIVEGAVYTQETLAPRSLNGSEFHYPENITREAFFQQPQQEQPRQQQFQQQQPQFQQPLQFQQPQFQQPIEKIVIVEEDAAAQFLPVREVIIQHPQQLQEPHHNKLIEETTTTTTTTTTAPAANAPGKRPHGIFHRHSKEVEPQQTHYTSSGSFNQANSGAYANQSDLTRGLLPNDHKHFHNERIGPNGQKIIEDTDVTRSHTEAVIPSRLI